MKKLKIGTSGEIVAGPQNGLFVENWGELAFLAQPAERCEVMIFRKFPEIAELRKNCRSCRFRGNWRFRLIWPVSWFPAKPPVAGLLGFSVFWPFWPSCRGMPVFPSWTCRGGLWAWCPF